MLYRYVLADLFILRLIKRSPQFAPNFKLFLNKLLLLLLYIIKVIKFFVGVKIIFASSTGTGLKEAISNELLICY